MKKVIPEGIEYIDAPLRASEFRKRIDPETERIKINVAISFDSLIVEPIEYNSLSDNIEEYLVDNDVGILNYIYLRVVGAIVNDYAGYVIVEVSADASDWLFEYEQNL